MAPTTQELADALWQSVEFTDDAHRLVQLDLTQVESAMRSLQNYDGFIDDQRTAEIIRSVVSDREAAESLTRFVLFQNNLRQGYTAALEFVEALVNSPSVQSQDESKEFAPQFQARLMKVLSPIPGRQLQAKAEALFRATGAHGHEFRVICDMRPVFNDSADSIEGIFPVVHLRFVKHVGNQKDPVEIMVSHQDLATLKKQIERAEQKIATIKQFAPTANIPSVTISGFHSAEVEE